MNSFYVKKWIESGNYETDPAVKKDEGFCYVAAPDHFVCAELYKIGKTHNIFNRLNALSTASPEPFKLFMLIKTINTRLCERRVHSLFLQNHFGKEFYVMYDEDFEHIKELFGEQVVFFDENGKTRRELEEQGELEGIL